ncbi:MAG: hypothetical protein COS42_10135 [Flavobacteriales bacterium CG03_land_8_20_14_0_80_35_15]|nr:MAG: hypothetical protein COS42_10135 [Flavobacteriales bacterium CG03_land_8_20_14_0_80_35_15]PJA05913.1 MAG: hypothetical protein COX71_04285 [Flavobacteriales bacterium CG_4_10_14_0_2_um_filter_35_18]
MKIDAHGSKQKGGKINPLLSYLKKFNDIQKWDYMGLTVEIDCTVDHKNQNLLVRWIEYSEGFNDRLIVYSFEEFNSLFSPIVND